MPVYMLLSVIASIAIGMIVYQFSENMTLSILTGVFLVIGDYIALSWLMGDDK